MEKNTEKAVSDKEKTENKKNTNDKIAKKIGYNFLFIIAIGAFLSVGVSILYGQYQHTFELNQKIEDVQKQIEDEKKKTEKINNQEDYYKSDEYVEKIAREQLSLVKPNEIIFVDRNK